jgi:hypothetical protein
MGRQKHIGISPNPLMCPFPVPFVVFGFLPGAGRLFCRRIIFFSLSHLLLTIAYYRPVIPAYRFEKRICLEKFRNHLLSFSGNDTM